MAPKMILTFDAVKNGSGKCTGAAVWSNKDAQANLVQKLQQ